MVSSGPFQLFCDSVKITRLMVKYFSKLFCLLQEESVAKMLVVQRVESFSDARQSPFTLLTGEYNPPVTLPARAGCVRGELDRQSCDSERDVAAGLRVPLTNAFMK